MARGVRRNNGTRGGSKTTRVRQPGQCTMRRIYTTRSWKSRQHTIPVLVTEARQKFAGTEGVILQEGIGVPTVTGVNTNLNHSPWQTCHCTRCMLRARFISTGQGLRCGSHIYTILFPGVVYSQHVYPAVPTSQTCPFSHAVASTGVQPS